LTLVVITIKSVECAIDLMFYFEPILCRLRCAWQLVIRRISSFLCFGVLDNVTFIQYAVVPADRSVEKYY